VKNSKTSGGDRRRCVAGANSIERGVVPVGHDIGIDRAADDRRKIYSADAGDEERISKNRAD